MMPRSERHDVALRAGAKLAFVAEVIVGGEVVREADVLPGGSVTIDGTASVCRRRASLTLGVASPADLPASDWRSDDGVGLWPTGNEIQLWAGIEYAPGDRELFPVGRFRIARPSASVSVDGGVALTLDLYDRARAVSKSRLRYTTMYQGNFTEVGDDVVYEGLNAIEALWNLVRMNAPFLDYSYPPATWPRSPLRMPPVILSTQDDPWEVAQQWATALGCELFFDGLGDPVLRYFRDPATTEPDFTYAEGAEGIIVAGSRVLDDDRAVSGVIAIADNSDLPFPYRAEAWDTNPNSPTYYDPMVPWASRFGRVPITIVSETINSQAGAQAAAELNLRRLAGLIESVQVETLPNYAAEARDVYAISLPSVNVLDEVYVADVITLPIGPGGTSSIQARVRSVT